MSGIGAALIGAGGSLIGGLLGGKGKSYSPREMALGHVEGVMQASEAFNINPLAILGALGGPSAVSGGGGNYMGQAIADASLIMADAVSKRKDAQKLQQEQQRNRELLEKIQSMTLRPKTGGIYANRVSTPNIASALGRGSQNAGSAYTDVSAAADSGGGNDVRPLPDTLPVDPRREVDNAPITSTGGFMAVDNPNMPFRLYMPTLDGDEPLQWYDYPSVVLPALGSAAYSLYETAERGDTRPGLKPADYRRERQRGVIPWETTYKEWHSKKAGGKAPYSADQLALPK